MAHEETPDKPIVPEKDIKPLADQLDQIAAGITEGGPEEAMEAEAVEGELDEVAAEEEVAAEAGPDLAPLMDMLGAPRERAQMLFDAAQQLEKTRGKTPEELAQMIVDDFDILMQLEMIAARGQGGAMGGPVAGALPPEAAAPPMLESPMPTPAEMEGV